MTTKQLTNKQRLFVAEYLCDLNATQAAIRAGYSRPSARITASKLLTKANVQAALAEAFDARIERTEITADRVLQEYARLGLSDMRQFVSWGPDGVSWKHSEELDEGAAACVSEVSETISEGGRTRRFKLHSKTTALDALAKHVGLAKHVEQRSGTTVNVNIDNRPAAKPLSEWTDEELSMYDSLLAPTDNVPND